MWKLSRRPKKEPKQASEGIRSWRQRVKATANFRRLFVVFFDVHRNAAISASDLPSDFGEGNNVSAQQVRTPTATLSRVASINLLAFGDEYEKLNFFNVQNGSASPSHSRASHGGRFLKVFKRKASNFSAGTTETSSSRNSVVHDVKYQHEKTTETDSDSQQEHLFVDQLQEELQILRERLEMEEAEMERLKSEVSTLRFGTRSAPRAPATDGTIIMSRNLSIRSDGSQSCLDFSLSPSGMLTFEGQFRSRPSAAHLQNKSRSDSISRLDSFLSDAAAVALRISENPEDVNNEVWIPADLEASTRYLGSVMEGSEHVVKIEDEDDDFGVTEVKFVEFQSIERTLSSRHRVSSNNEEEDIFHPHSIPDGKVKTSRSPPKSAADEVIVSKSNVVDTEYTYNDTDKPWYSRSLVNFDIPISEERQSVEMRFHALEEKLLGTLRSFKKKSITTPTADTVQQLDHSVEFDSNQESHFSISRSPLATSNIPWCSRERDFADFDQVLAENPRVVKMQYPDKTSTRRKLYSPNRTRQTHGDFECSVVDGLQVSEKGRGELETQIFSEDTHAVGEKDMKFLQAELVENDIEWLQGGRDQAVNNLSMNEDIQNSHGLDIMFERRSPRGVPISTSGEYAVDHGSTRDFILPTEENDLEEEVRQCLEYSRRLLQEETGKSGKSVQEDLWNAYPLSSHKRFSREASFSVLSHSRQRRSLEKSNSSVGLTEHRRPQNEDFKHEIAEQTRAPEVSFPYEDNLKQFKVKDMTVETMPVNEDWTSSESVNQQYETQTSSPSEENLHCNDLITSEPAPEHEDPAAITPTRLREALDSWDKKRSDRNVGSKNPSPKFQNSRRTRFYVEAANSA